MPVTPLTPTCRHPLASAGRRVLSSNLVDLLLGPHGIDRYLELIRPEITIRDARAKVLAVRRQTPRTVTLTLEPNSAFAGFRAGQFVRVGVELDGVRRTRTYSPCSSQHDTGMLELTITAHPEGAVSRLLCERSAPGQILHLGQAQGDFVLPAERPRRLVLISGGSGITPVLSMLRTLLGERHDGELSFLHFARTREDWLYRAELDELARRHANLRVAHLATREGDAHVSRELLEPLAGRLENAHAAVCGPPALIDAVSRLWPEPGNVITETFTPAAALLAAAAGQTASGTLHFLRSGSTAQAGAGTLLEQAEAAGLRPEFGCRMGICHTCICRKAAGTVKNLLTGELSAEEDEDIQLCVSVPAGDVALEI